MEPTQNAHRAPTVFDIFDQARTRAHRKQLLLRPIPVPEGQILRHDLRYGRQAHTVRSPRGRVQILVHVEGQSTYGLNVTAHTPKSSMCSSSVLQYKSTLTVVCSLPLPL